MKTVKTVLTIALAVMVMGVVSASAGTDGTNAKTAKGERSTTLKKGDQTQGTFAYRFNTYTQYTGGGEGEQCNATSNPECTSELNDALRMQSTAYSQPAVGKFDKPTKQVKSTVNKAVAKPAND